MNSGAGRDWKSFATPVPPVGLDRSLSKESSAATMNYDQLDEEQDQIRLITILPSAESSGFVHCTLETVSLKAVTPEYREYIYSADAEATSRRKTTIGWTNAYSDPNIEQIYDRDSTHVPSSSTHRFTWGDYAALSYVWGGRSLTDTIVVNGQETRVGRNLYIALRALSQMADILKGFKLWVDAICINQDDFQERSRQIGKMQRIYGEAWIVIAWLGEEENNSHEAIDLIQILCGASVDGRGEEVAARLRNDPVYLGRGCWMALEHFMRRDYWTRLWIIQEVVLGSSSLNLLCGNRFIHWTSFCQGIGFLYEHLWNIKDDLLVYEIIATGPQLSVRSFGWRTANIHLVYQDLWALSHLEAQGGGDRLSFAHLLDLANSASSQDARDKVYGLVGMMEPNISKNLVPDYKLDVRSVYAGISKMFILTYRSLEPIREGNPWGTIKSPSWAADWTWNGRIRHRRPETNLWGPFWNQKGPRPIVRAAIAYNAGGEESMKISFSNDDLNLTCRGFLVDEISGLTARELGYFEWAEQSMIQPKQENTAYGNHVGVTKAIYRTLVMDRVARGEKASERHGNSKGVAKALYRTLVMDRVAGGKKSSERHAAILNLPCTFQNAQDQFKRLGWRWLSNQEGYYFRWERWREANRKFRLMGRTLDEYFNETIPDGASEYDYTEVYSSFDRTCKGRRLMTTKNGYLGWAPDNMYGNDTDQVRLGDKIAIIFGCSTPIVIRPQGNHFLVLGEAYVQGLMDGEAVEFLKSGQCEVQDFLFC